MTKDAAPSTDPTVNCVQGPETPIHDFEPIYATEVIGKMDPRCSLPEMHEAVVTEIAGLRARKTFLVVKKSDIPPNANTLPARFVFSIKTDHLGRETYKARFVIGGHRDKLKKLMVHSTETMQPLSVRTVLVLTASHGFDIWTSDVRQAFLQSTVPLGRAIFISDMHEAFGLAPDECFKVMKPQYGLCDAGDLWHATLDKHHQEELDMKPLRMDPALYIYTDKRTGTLRGLSGTFIDDMIRSGTPEFRQHARKTNAAFDMAEDESTPCDFTGFHISRCSQTKALLLDQDRYLDKIKPLPTDASFSTFRSFRMQLAWKGNSRPDLLCEISFLSQVTEKQFLDGSAKIIRASNAALAYARLHHVRLHFPALELDSLSLVGFSDASFANNTDDTTQLGYILFLCDAKHGAAPLHFRSYKARRIVRSVMTGELLAFDDLFDVAFTLAEELRCMHPGSPIPLRMLTDSKCLFDVISKGSRTSERRLMLDIAASRQAFNRHEISDIGFIRSGDNIADSLTKPMRQAKLRTALGGKLAVAPEQWIIRTPAPSVTKDNV